MIRLKELIYLFFVRIPLYFYGKYIKRNLVKVHWERGLNNFGDCLSPDIMRHYGLTPVYASQKKSDIILAGSILQWVPKDYSGYIIGTGGDDFKYDFPNAKILAVRGYKTLSNLKIKEGVLLGDPGLLMPYIFNIKKKRIYKLGIIPHFVDYNTDVINRWKYKFKQENVLFINVLRTPKEVISDILECENIISSSLHGLIIADAYHIPNVRFINRVTMPTYFYDYKFDDYYSSLGIIGNSFEINGEESIDFLLEKVTLKPIEKIEFLKSDLNNIMIQISKHFKK